MIPKYHESSVEVEVHSDKHNECQPSHLEELEEGWQCCCEQCMCEYVAKIKAAYAFDKSGRHKVIMHMPPFMALTPDKARELASALCFAAIDAEQLDRDFPND